MSRRRSELSHVVYSGWMIKSPPEKKLMGPWKIFRALSGDASNTAKWKRRYFVLSKPAQSLPGTYHLNYYSDENCRRLRGSIDLEQCAEIVESLDSDQFKFLLAIKTTHRGRERTYFLATDTEEQMTTWVRNLCTVCGMRPDEVHEELDGSPQPPRREELPPVNRRVQSTQPTLPVNPEIMSKPPNMLSSSMSASNQRSPAVHGRSRISAATSPPKAAAVGEMDSEYIPLETCSSGTSIRRTTRQDSVPDEEAPPPPVLFSRHGKGDDSENEVFGGINVYDVPPSLKEGDNEDDGDDIYKVPPSRSHQSALEAYDNLPTTHHSPSSPRSSSSEKVDSAYSSGQMYDVPPTRTDGGEIYDIPPSHGGAVMSLPDHISLDVVPPVRPPKPGSLHGQSMQGAQESYMNLPMNSKVYTKNKADVNVVVQPGGSDKKHIPDLYDIPPCAGSDRSLCSKVNDSLSLSPPPPHIFGSKEHKYINAHGGVVPDQEMYLAMDPVGKDADLPLGRKSSSTDNEVEYTDMSGKSSFDDSFEGNSKSIYDHPPPTSSRATKVPPRPAKSAVPDNLPQDMYSIYSTARTRSFKRKTEGSPLLKHKTGAADNVTKPRAVPIQNKVQLPVKPDLHPDFSTSDEEDDEMESPTVWDSTPPAPTTRDNDIKYVELDHDNEDPTEKEPMRSPHATEYHEIDFVKTVALQNVKEIVNVERSKEWNNNS